MSNEVAVPEQAAAAENAGADGELTLEQLRSSNHHLLERIAQRAAQNMQSSAYSSHNSHHSAHN
jgi:uncharacterized lipoprotein